MYNFSITVSNSENIYFSHFCKQTYGNYKIKRICTLFNFLNKIDKDFLTFEIFTL